MVKTFQNILCATRMCKPVFEKNVIAEYEKGNREWVKVPAKLYQCPICKREIVKAEE